MRAYNFCAGPASLPIDVLNRAKNELLDWRGTGMSIMEMSHRGDDFVGIANKAEADLRKLLGVPDHYKVLFLQGGASLQFSAVPLNLLGTGQTADYVDTGIWSSKAIEEARRYGNVNVVASSKADKYRHVPAQSEWQQTRNAAYLHYTPNETIGGLQYDFIPEVDASVPLVADYSSSILSEPLDVSKFGLIYAGAQKNIGPAGLTLVIVRDDLLDRSQSINPSLLNYGAQAKHDSMINTPPTYGWYLAGLVFEWLLDNGGLTAIAAQNDAKAKLLYDYIDQSGFYANAINHANRSKMNVPFTLADSALEAAFLQESEAQGLLNLAGHRSVGGMRASIYNAVPLEGVQELVKFMQQFAAKHG